jgi:hypothetical protein
MSLQAVTFLLVCAFVVVSRAYYTLLSCFTLASLYLGILVLANVGLRFSGIWTSHCERTHIRLICINKF